MKRTTHKILVENENSDVAQQKKKRKLFQFLSLAGLKLLKKEKVQNCFMERKADYVGQRQGYALAAMQAQRTNFGGFYT